MSRRARILHCTEAEARRVWPKNTKYLRMLMRTRFWRWYRYDRQATDLELAAYQVWCLNAFRALGDEPPLSRTTKARRFVRFYLRNKTSGARNVWEKFSWERGT